MRISEIYDMDIYGDNGQYLGQVQEAIVDLERGEVSRLLMEQWRNIDKTEMRKILQNKSVLFKNIRNIGDVVLVAANPNQAAAAQAQGSSENSASAAEFSDLTARR